MKRLFLVFNIAMAMSCLGLQSLRAQTRLFADDGDVRVGTLSNGLTYYIRHNTEPRGRAYFYIAQKVGSIQEEPQQRGLAHFLEHMCFNGTTHFPGNSLRTYLESVGVKFGVDLNAYTSVDETVYNIDNVPVGDGAVIDSCLWILHDWSHDLTLADKDVDDERAVIREEWRMRNDARQRVNEKVLPVLFNGSRYADCMPIGSMDVVMNFKYGELRDYYERWYRPELQGVIVVGDVDVDDIERRIGRIFADIPAAAEGAPKHEYYDVPRYDAPRVCVAKDREATSTMVTYYFRHASHRDAEKNSREYMVNAYLDGAIYSMFHDRTVGIAQRPGAPFAFCYVQDGDFFVAKRDRALAANVSCKSNRGDLERGVKAMFGEIARVCQHGFTATEYERYRNSFMDGIAKRKALGAHRQSVAYVNEYTRHFLDGEPIPSMDDEMMFYETVIPNVGVDQLNERFRFLFADTANIAIVVTANDSIDVPAGERLVDIMNTAMKERMEAYVDDVPTQPFLPMEPTAGRIVSERVDRDGKIRMELSNGAKVVVKKTDLKKGEILMQGLSKGGMSLVDSCDYKYGSLINMLLAVQGSGNYSYSEFQKAFAGKNARVDVSVTDNFQTVAGSADRKDLGVMMEMAHAAFLYPHKDTVAFRTIQERLINSYMVNQSRKATMMMDSMNVALYGNSVYVRQNTDADYRDADYDKILSIYRDRFADASGFTFTFVGDVDMDELRPLVEKYLASLPSLHRNEKARSIKTVIPGERRVMFNKQEETEKASIYFQQTYRCGFDQRNAVMADMLGQIMNIVYTRTIREEAGAAYSVGCGAALDYYPESQVRFVVQFPTSPQQRDTAVSLIIEGLEKVANEGPTEEDVKKVREYILKVHEGNLRANRYWQYALSYEWNHGTALEQDYVKAVKSITSSDIRKFARRMLKQRNRVVVCMTSDKK